MCLTNSYRCRAENIGRGLLLLTFAAALHAATPCPAPRDTPPGTTLADLASRNLGSASYAIAIALATNARTGNGFSYIANPDDLTGITHVCVPSESEAHQLKDSWDTYERALDSARLPRTASIDKMLVTIPPDQPVNVVTWMRQQPANQVKAPSTTTAASETWVTVEPNLQEFCRAYVRDHGPDEAGLTRRLEQRLGLSPASNKVTFVRMRLDHPGPDVIFRPCTDSAADHANCGLGPPTNAPPAYRQWFLEHYYSSYGQSLFGQFPWTALGYTFDWAPGPDPSSFQRTGESEFVIPKDAPIAILEKMSTSQYCAPLNP